MAAVRGCLASATRLRDYEFYGRALRCEMMVMNLASNKKMSQKLEMRNSFFKGVLLPFKYQKNDFTPDYLFIII